MKELEEKKRQCLGQAIQIEEHMWERQRERRSQSASNLFKF